MEFSRKHFAFLPFWLFVVPIAYGAQPDLHFEPFADYFIGLSGSYEVRVMPDRMQFHGASVRWLGGGAVAFSGERPTGGVTNYYQSADSAKWRSGVPHFSQLRGRSIYPGIDFVVRSHGADVEFDLEIKGGAKPGAIAFEVSETSKVTAAGDLAIGESGAVLRRPVAWQTVNGTRHMVSCNFQIRDKKVIQFALGDYDPTIELTIDPIVQFATYLGGDTVDAIQAVAADKDGNVIVAGGSTSTNFPGVEFGTPTVFTFVSKLNSTGSAILYTTVLGSGPRGSTEINTLLDSIAGVVLDSSGSAYVAGRTTHAANFPLTPGTWNTIAGNGFATKLDSAGALVYSTFIGGPGWPVNPDRIAVLNGIAYLAGTVSYPKFAGTTGAFQTRLNGTTDFFVVALAADGSAPVFATAIGGSGSETMTDMALDRVGNVLLCGRSTSIDFPRPASTFSNYTSGAVIARLSADGTKLLDSTYLGTANVASIGGSADGKYFYAVGNTTFVPPAGSKAVATQLALGRDSGPGYVAAFTGSPLQLVWSTSLPVTSAGKMRLQTDTRGNIYYLDTSQWLGGGTPQAGSGTSLVMLSSDGSEIQFLGATGTGPLSDLHVSPNSQVVVGGYAYGGLATTSGAVGPNAPTKPLLTLNNRFFLTTGFVSRYDMSGVSGGNFFVKPPSSGTGFNWRIGEPVPIAISIPVAYSAKAFPVTVTTSTAGLTATLSSTGDALAVNVVPGSITAAGMTVESVTLTSAADADKTVTLGVSLQVLPQLTIAPDTTQINFTLRAGQTPTPVKIGITENFGKERPGLQLVTYNRAIVNAQVYNDSDAHGLLTLTPQALTPGTYDTDAVVGIVGLRNGTQTVKVHIAVTPAVSVQLSSATVVLHVVKGQAAPTASVDVTSATPGIPFAYVPSLPSWLIVRNVGAGTPGRVEFSVDVASVPIGYLSYTFTVAGEGGQQVQGTLLLDVASGAALDITPASIDVTYYRTAVPNVPLPPLSFTSVSPVAIALSSNKPWLPLNKSQGTTPFSPFWALDGTMPEGIYQATISVVAGNLKTAVPVTFRLFDTPRLVFPTTPLTFNYQIGGPLPATQAVSVTSPTLNPGGFTAGTPSPSFVTVGPAIATTPATLTVSVNPTGLAPGTFNSNVTVFSSYGTAYSTGIIPVTLVVTDAAPLPTVSSLVDAASYVGGGVSPGEVVVLYGSQLGPDSLVSAQPDGGNRYPTTLAGTIVYFDRTAVPILYASSGQVAVVVPYALAGNSTTSVSVWRDGGAGPAITLPIRTVSPALFTADASGKGQAAALVVNSGGTAVNSADRPAAAGDILVLYGTGLGANSPVVVDGTVTTVPLPKTLATVQVSVGGKSAEVLYSGPAPGLVAGVCQLNVRVPAGLPVGPAAIQVVASSQGMSAPSPSGVTVALN